MASSVVLPFHGVYPSQESGMASHSLLNDSMPLEDKLLMYKKKKNAKLYIQSNKPYYYIYRIKGDGVNAVGLVGLVPHEFFRNGLVAPHEKTLKRKELSYSRSLFKDKVQINPVLLFYRDNDPLTSLLKHSESNFNAIFKSNVGGMSYEIAPILDQKILVELKRNLRRIDKLYIADGHHRVNASISAAEKHKSMPKYCLSMLLSSEAIKVGSINRGIKDEVVCNWAKLAGGVKKYFNILKTDFPHVKRHSYGLYTKGQWYQLSFKAEILKEINALESLDPFIIHNRLLKNLFKIHDKRSNEKLMFFPDSHGHIYLEEMVSSGNADVIVCVPPINIDDLCNVADACYLVPPHSTCLHPKPLNGTICWEY